MIFLNLFIIVSAAIAQTTVKGLVLSSEGNEPVIGASVKVVGAEKGVITDTDGNFSISVNSLNERLEVSYIGMITKIVKASNNLKVVLDPDHKQIEEVIVVAYGKQKKEAFTGAAGVVGSETLSKRVVSNASTALAGSVAGVQMYSTNGAPGADPIIRVRGIGSISSSNKPLIILDGVPYDGDISSINPSDIASMTVLKDAASNAIYGARGANGVVMITTKNGNTGDAKVTFDAKWGTNSRLIPQYDIIKDPGLYTQTQFKSLYNSQLYAGQSAADAYAYATASIFDANNGGLGYPIYTVPTGENLIKEDFSINILELEVDERARMGLFLAMQYPSEIPGITNAEFLRAAMNAGKEDDEKISVREFITKLDEKMELLNMKEEMAERYLNEGFSGGEKKRNEILQLLMLEPTFALLDEIDSGLDIDALKVVSKGVNAMRGEGFGAMIITHYQRLLNYITPDVVHVMMEGRVVLSGGPELAARLEREGYAKLAEELGYDYKEEL